MSATFPKTSSRKFGYSIEQVEDFLQEAREAYTSDYAAQAFTADRVRRVAFEMEKGGYSPPHVDAALERLEDAFAARQRDRTTSGSDHSSLIAEKRVIAQEIVDRLARPAGDRFSRVNLLATGYRRSDVDEFMNEVFAHFTEGTRLSVTDVRTAAFRPQRGGYSETQVDVLLDEVVGILITLE